MGTLTDYSELELLDHIFNVAYTPVTNIYLALCTADPTDAATGASMNECANANAYARTEITVGAAATRRVTQDAGVTFPQATGSWGTASHWAIVDNNTYGAGNVLAHGAFATGKAIANGNTPSVASGEVWVEFTASEIGDVVAGKLLDLMFNNTAYAAPDTYIAALTAVANSTLTGSTITEPSGNGYARVQVNINGGSSPTWDLAASGALANTHAFSFPQASGGSWGTIVGYAVVSAASAGDLIGFDNDAADQAVGDGDTLTFPIGDFDVTMD